jgi:hypothetical protein
MFETHQTKQGVDDTKRGHAPLVAYDNVEDSGLVSVGPCPSVALAVTVRGGLPLVQHDGPSAPIRSHIQAHFVKYLWLHPSIDEATHDSPSLITT